ncbi:MAG: permease prefix domain 1-containing protein [Planctomycetota bacterium]|nr:permease prefix domain 1-containing protein [Planctomycetota bacterium]
MSLALEQYLDRVLAYANRSPDDAAAIRAELKDHLESRVAEFEAEGLAREDAIFKSIEAHGNPRKVGYGLRPRFAWIDIRTHGTARGFIAIGPKAIGVFAFGGTAVGVFALGGLSIGALSYGGFALGAFLAYGGLAVAPLGLALGGIALGAVAVGGMAVGLVASGGCAAGLFTLNSGASATWFAEGDAPVILQWLSLAVRNPRYVQWSFVGFYAFFLPTFGMSQLLMRRESKRILGADPTLAE